MIIAYFNENCTSFFKIVSKIRNISRRCYSNCLNSLGVVYFLQLSLSIYVYIIDNKKNVLYISEEYSEQFEYMIKELAENGNYFEHTYKREEIISIGKNTVNLEDKDIK